MQVNREEIIDRILNLLQLNVKSTRNRYLDFICNGNYKKHMQGNLTVSNKEYSYENERFVGAQFRMSYLPKMLAIVSSYATS